MTKPTHERKIGQCMEGKCVNDAKFHGRIVQHVETTLIKGSGENHSLEKLEKTVLGCSQHFEQHWSEAIREATANLEKFSIDLDSITLALQKKRGLIQHDS